MNTNLIPGLPDVVGARSDRVRLRTSSQSIERIDSQTNANIEATINGGRDAVIARVQQLDREWHVDRVLMATFGLLGAASLLAPRSRILKSFLATQMGFLAAHAFIGWSPVLPLVRRLGFRTAREIAAERYALVDYLDANDDQSHPPLA